MGFNIRKITASDAPAWLELLESSLGTEYPDPQVYDLGWIIEQLSRPELETWALEHDGKFASAISFLPPLATNLNPIANLGRQLDRPDSLTNGATAALLRKVTEVARERSQIIISRLIAADSKLQTLYENEGFNCVGYQPFKHTLGQRHGVLFYYSPCQEEISHRLPISESLTQIHELGTLVLQNLNLPVAATVRDGVAGYPLQTELAFTEAPFEEFQNAKQAAVASHNPPVEISGSWNQGFGYMRNEISIVPQSILGVRDGKTTCGIAFVLDPVDRCLKIMDGFTTDNISLGSLFHHLIKQSEQKMNMVYVEFDALITAPRLLKAAEQLGFVPVAYLPAVFSRSGSYTDVVKLVKLNMAYSLDARETTVKAGAVVKVIDHNFEDQKMGVAIINLLRALPFFAGLGDGELRKVARLFTQKLFRPGERIFNKGDSSSEAYVVMRGQIDILLEERSEPLARMGNGQIFGEIAFLDDAPRTAMAIASQASILLVIQRSAFQQLAQQEPHLGMVVMRNIAIELSNRLRKTNAALSSKR